MGLNLSSDARGRLPDFLIIGGIRCGTTSLYRYLDAHSGIAMARSKELRFFTKNYGKGEDWYRAHFRSVQGHQKCGEASPQYLSSRVAVNRMSAMVPQAKLIVSLRNPVDRAWSDYWMMRARGREIRPFRRAIEEEVETIRGASAQDLKDFRYVWNGLYDRHLAHVFSLFPDDQILMVLFDDLVENTVATFMRVCGFLGADQTEVPPNLGRQVNPYVSFRSVRLRRVAKRLPYVMERAIATVNTRSSDSYPEMAQSDRTFLAQFFAPHMKALEEVLGLELPELTRR